MTLAHPPIAVPSRHIIGRDGLETLPLVGRCWLELGEVQSGESPQIPGTANGSSAVAVCQHRWPNGSRYAKVHVKRLEKPGLLFFAGPKCMQYGFKSLAVCALLGQRGLRRIDNPLNKLVKGGDVQHLSQFENGIARGWT